MTFSLKTDTGSTFASLPRTTYKGWTIVEIPKDYKIFKSMPPTRTTVKNPENPYSSSTAWFSSKPVADLYTEQENKLNRNHMTYEFTTLKSLKLLYLPDLNNLKKLLTFGIEGDEDFEAFKATTGAGLNFQQQVDWWKYMLGSKYTANLRTLRKPTELPILTEGDVQTGTGFHRVSLRTYLDRKMMAFLCKHTKLDGYICPNVPTFIVMKDYPMPYIHEEIGLCIQKKNIEVQVGDTIPDFLGFTSGIKKNLSEGTITKVFFKTEKSISAIERELVASKVIDHHKLADSYATLREFKADGEQWKATGDLYTTDIETYFIKNQEKLSIRTIQTILNKLLQDSDTLNKIGILHYDLNLNNCFLKGRKIRIGDFGSSYVRGYKYKHSVYPPLFDRYMQGKLDQKTLLVDTLLLSAVLAKTNSIWKDMYVILKDKLNVNLPAQLLKQKSFPEMKQWFNEHLRGFSKFYAKIPNSAVEYFKL